MDDTDERLIQRMAMRDEGALEELHRRYASYFMALAWRVLHDADLARECVQDAFLSAWNAAPRFDPSRASGKTWLVTIAHRRALTAHRDRPQTALPIEEWDAPTAAPNLDEQYVVKRAVDTLDQEERQLVELAFYQGYSHSELAVLTGKPLGTVKSKLRGALARLRTHFRDEPGKEVPRGDRP